MAHRIKHAFVLRCIVQVDEARPDHPPALRGSLQHVETGLSHPYSSLEALLDLLTEYLGLSPRGYVTAAPDARQADKLRSDKEIYDE